MALPPRFVEEHAACYRTNHAASIIIDGDNFPHAARMSATFSPSLPITTTRNHA